MSFFRRYDLMTKNTALQHEPTPGKYRKLTDDEVYMEWMRTRGKLSTSPPATPPLDLAKRTEKQIRSPYTGSKIPTPKKTTRKHHLSESLLRTLKESNVDELDEVNEKSCWDKSNSVDMYGGKMYAVTMGTQPPADCKDNADLHNDFREVQVDRVEEFVAKKKRHTLKRPSDKTSPVKREKQNVKQTSSDNRKFVLVANPCYTTHGMEQSNVIDKADIPVQQSNTEITGQNVNSKDEASGSTVAGRLSSLEDVLLHTMGNQETKDRGEGVTSPQRNEDQTVPLETDEDFSFFSEREVCADSSLITSPQSRCSTSDDDTLNSISSDEVNVYVDSNGKVKDDVKRTIVEGDDSLQLGAASSWTCENDTMSSPEREGRQRFGEVSPSRSSEMADASTADDSRSLSNSSQDACSRSREGIVIPKIRINGDLPEDSRNSNLSDQCTGTTGSQDVSIGTIDSMEGAIAGRSHRSSIDSGTGSDPVRQVHNHFVVVAIDFGTTYSGYAFSFNRHKEKIHIMRKWEGGDPGVINQKTLTTLLLTPDEKFHSFGFTARDTFHNLKPQDSKKWHYFEKFKMVLHYSTELNKETCLRSSNGSLISALTVFTFALEFFKTHALQELGDLSGTRLLTEDVRWVITVPAIWRAQAKQFMRQAAYQAGIASEDFPGHLLIALEPEAASVCCRKLRMYQVLPESDNFQPPLLSPRRSSSQPKNLDHVLPEIQEDGSSLANNKTSESVSLSSFPQTKESDLTKGTRYMVVDCGGGTVDITVHEIQDNHGRLRELYKATGGPYGSVGVDIEFENLLCGIFGSDFIHHFQQKRPAGWDDLMIAFESRKRSACPDKVNPLNVSLPFSFIDLYKKTKGSLIESAVRKYGDPHIRWSSQGMLRLAPEAMRRLFLPTLNRIKQTIGDIMNHPDARALRYLFLVGGFAESRILQSEIRKEFGHIVRVIIPQGVSLAILEGAVLFGWDPSVINIRRSRLTYGIGVLNRFDRDKHPEDKRLSKNGSDWCIDVFECFVKVNQSVSLGDTVMRSYTPARPGQRSSVINIFCTERSDVKFVTDNGVRRCGTLCLDLTDCQYQAMPSRREIQTRMFFGDTEIKVTALDVATGKTVRAGIDFLSK